MRNWLLILTSILLALVLALLPMPTWAIWLRPAWVLMVIIFWVMTVPDVVNVGIAWFVGILVDLLKGGIIGEHALAYAIVAYIVYRLYTQMRMYPIVQQSVAVMVFVFIYQVIFYCIQGFVGVLPNSYLYWLSPVTSMLLWPWLSVLLGDYQRRLQIA